MYCIESMVRISFTSKRQRIYNTKNKGREYKQRKMLSFKTLKKNKREKKGPFSKYTPGLGKYICGRFRLYDRSNNSLIIIIVYCIELWRGGGELCSHTRLWTNKQKIERVPAEQFSNKPSKPERKEFSIHPKELRSF